MKVDLRDREAAAQLRPLEVAAYLRATGWAQRTLREGLSSVWTRALGEEQYEVLLPLDQALADFPLRMGDLLRVLAEVEQRSPAQVYADLLTTAADVVRIAIQDPELQDGTMPIEAHAVLAQKARDLVLAAACAVTERRAVWHTRKPAQAMEYVRRVRVGQSERGSYIMTLISRVTPALHATQGQLFEGEPPYERRVMEGLAKALTALEKAAERAALTAELQSFVDAVPEGVSANLCEAVAGLWGEDQSQRRVDFSFSWAAARSVDMGVPSQVSLAADRIPVIREAARLLVEQAPVSDYELEGAVVRLERAEGAPSGRATIIGSVEGKQRRVVIEMDDADYSLAVRAHGEQRPFRCVGNLVREGKGYSLRSPRDLVVEEE
jgi:hypothetical protein